MWMASGTKLLASNFSSPRKTTKPPDFFAEFRRDSPFDSPQGFFDRRQVQGSVGRTIDAVESLTWPPDHYHECGSKKILHPVMRS